MQAVPGSVVEAFFHRESHFSHKRSRSLCAVRWDILPDTLLVKLFGFLFWCSFCGVTCRTRGMFMKCNSSLPRCNTDAQFQMLRSLFRLRSKSLPSVFGRLFNRQDFFANRFTSFQTQLRRNKKKKSRININCYSMLLDIDVTELLSLNFWWRWK